MSGTVRCRTGSLEMLGREIVINQYVRCRTGSLENHQWFGHRLRHVRCRTGSLEMGMVSTYVDV